jgi:hypothetical protein
MAIKCAKKHHTQAVSFIDHWGNYQERFTLEGELILPDEIWVADRYALEIAREKFQDVAIRLLENPYMLDIQDEIAACDIGVNKEDDRCRVLYICEPVSTHARKKTGRDDGFGYTEFEAMDLFMSHLRKLSVSARVFDVRIRPHPSESADKYDAYIANQSDGLMLAKSTGASLIEDCAWADWVVGMSSMALVIALMAGKKVFCCIPGHSRSEGLPYEKIQNFLDLGAVD